VDASVSEALTRMPLLPKFHTLTATQADFDLGFKIGNWKSVTFTKNVPGIGAAVSVMFVTNTRGNSPLQFQDQRVYAVTSLGNGRVQITAVNAAAFMPSASTVRERLNKGADDFFAALLRSQAQSQALGPASQALVVNGKSVSLSSPVPQGSSIQRLVNALKAVTADEQPKDVPLQKGIATLVAAREAFLKEKANALKEMPLEELNYVALSLDVEAGYNLKKVLPVISYGRQKEIQNVSIAAKAIKARIDNVTKFLPEPVFPRSKTLALIDEAILLGSIDIAPPKSKSIADRRDFVSRFSTAAMPNAIRDAFLGSAVGGALGLAVTKFGAIALGKVATQSATGSIVPVIGTGVAVLISIYGVTVTVMDGFALVDLIARRDALDKKLSNPAFTFTERELCQLGLEKTKIDSAITAKVTGVAFNLADIGVAARAAFKARRALKELKAPEAPSKLNSPRPAATSGFIAEATKRIASLKGLVLDPRLNSTNLEAAQSAQSAIKTQVYSILKSLSIPTDVTSSMPTITTSQATKMIEVLKRLDLELPIQAREDPYVRNLMLSIGYHLMKPKTTNLDVRAGALDLGAAIKALGNSQCPGAPDVNPALWSEAKATLLPWLRNWSEKLKSNSIALLSQQDLVMPSGHHRSADSVGRVLIDNEATTIGAANGYFGAIAAGIAKPSAALHGIDPSLDFPIAFGQGYSQDRLVKGLMPAWHEVHNLFAQNTGINEYSPALNILTVNLNKAIRLSDLLKPQTAKKLTENAAIIFNTLDSLKRGLRLNPSQPQRWTLNGLEGMNGDSPDVFGKLVKRGLIQVSHPKFAEVKKFYRDIEKIPANLTGGALKAFKAREFEALKIMMEMNKFTISNQTQLTNQMLGVRYLMANAAPNWPSTKFTSIDPKHLDLLLRNPPKDLLQLTESQMTKLIQAGGGTVENGVWVDLVRR
jgi:hypothetical protein